jgi:diacylglycerol kinase family enzyme
MAGVGFDARVVPRVDLRLKRAIGRGAYALAILQEWLTYKPVRYRVTIDGREPVDVASAIVVKSRLYGGPFVLAADASVLKPALHVCLFHDGGRGSALRYLAAVGLGTIAQSQGFEIVTATRVAIAGPTDEPVQADGDTVATLPVEVALADPSLAVIAEQP